MKKDIRGRNLIASERFNREAAAISPNMQRFDEMMEPLNLLLPDYPERGTPSATPDIWTHTLRDGDVGAVVYYRFDDTTVTLLSIRPTKG